MGTEINNNGFFEAVRLNYEQTKLREMSQQDLVEEIDRLCHDFRWCRLREKAPSEEMIDRLKVLNIEFDRRKRGE